jgi:hypothetical protein
VNLFPNSWRFKKSFDGTSPCFLETAAIFRLLNVEYPLAKVLFSGQIERGISNDEVLSSLPSAEI